MKTVRSLITTALIIAALALPSLLASNANAESGCHRQTGPVVGPVARADSSQR